MHDVVIRNGKVVDGTGAPARIADVAIDGGVITQVGGTVGAGVREIDAQGQVVTPGFVDVHTHFDGQASWDPYLTPTGWHGVTTVVMGNCGVGFAPARAEDREWVIQLMEGVEDIPGAALTEGITWNWETFPEYLDALADTPRALDIGTQVPHGALRVFAMGKRGAQHVAATRPEIERMREIVQEAIEAGALGFSTSRTLLHRGSDGELVPGTYAAEDELLGIARGLEAAGAGVFQMTSNHDEMADEFVWMRKIAEETGRPVAFNLQQIDQAPQLYKKLLAMVEEATAAGLSVTPHVAGRPPGILQGWDCTVHPFLAHPSYVPLMNLPLAERVEKLRDPEVKARIISEEPIPGALDQFGDFATFVTRSFHKMFPLGADPNYEPSPEESVAAVAARQGREPLDVVYDMLLENDGKNLIYFPVFNYSAGDLEVVREMLEHPLTCISLGDGGAHCKVICDSSIPTFVLTHWVMGRTRGPRLSLEAAVKKQTSDTAKMYGLLDRGVLAPGYKADVNVIDLENLTLHAPEMVDDLPAGGRRLIQRSTGYTYTLLNGVVTFENGEPTGALPGGLIRGEQSQPADAVALAQ